MLSLCECCIRDSKGLPANRALRLRKKFFFWRDLANWSQRIIEILENGFFFSRLQDLQASEPNRSQSWQPRNRGWSSVVRFEAPPTLIEYDMISNFSMGKAKSGPTIVLSLLQVTRAITSTLLPGHPHQKIKILGRQRTSQCEQLLD